MPRELLAGPFTTRTAALHGVTDDALRGRTWRQLFRGVWIAADAPIDRGVWLEAARLVLPVDATLCCWSALDLYGLDVRRVNDHVVHAAFDRAPRKRQGMALRELKLAPDEVRTRGRWLVTSPTRTAFDCARLFPFVDAVIAVDALGQAGWISPEELVDFAAAHPGIRWVRRIPRVVAAADVGAESPMETRVRLILTAAGLTNVVTQYEVRSPAGVFLARLDLAFPWARVAVEYDGAWHWDRRRDDDRRRDALRALGWTVIVVSAEDVFRHPDRVVSQVRAALASSAA